MMIALRRAPFLLRDGHAGDAAALGGIVSEWAESTEWMPQVHSRDEATELAAQLIARARVTVACPTATSALAPRLRAGRAAGTHAEPVWSAPAQLLRRRRHSAPVGFIAWRGSFVHALYLAPQARRRGLGRALLAHAKADATRLTLWVFSANAVARAFYAREGFVPVEAGDGSGNDEGLPDLRLEWSAG